MAQPTRPLSPHLFIYKSQITMAMSIIHRATGMILYVGVAILVFWLGAAAAGGAPLSFVNALAASWFGQLVLIGLTWALFHHMLGGLRHFIWDFGEGFSREARFGMAWATLIGGIVLTLITWVFFVWL